MRIRTALWTAALALASSLVVVSAGAADPPGKPHPVKDAKEAVKDAKDKLKDAKNDAKDAAGDAKKEAKQDAKEAKKELQEARQKLKDSRKDRRETMRKAVTDKWGDLVKKPKARSELTLHAQRMAKLNYMEYLAKQNDKDQLVERIKKMRERENDRHEHRMEALKAKGGEE